MIHHLEYLIQDVVKLLWRLKFCIPASMCQFKGVRWVQYKLSLIYSIYSTYGIIFITTKINLDLSLIFVYTKIEYSKQEYELQWGTCEWIALQYKWIYWLYFWNIV